MRKKPATITPELCLIATKRIARSQEDVDAAEQQIDLKGSEVYKDLAKRELSRLRQKLKDDPSRESRLADQTCLRCAYHSRIGGAAITTQPCGLCGANQVFGSTATDLLCQPCAVANELCKHCAGDIEGRVDRTEFPSSDHALVSG